MTVTQKTMIRDLTTGSVAKKLLLFSLPLMLSQLLQTCYGIVDMIVVGRYVGKVGLSAVSVGGDLLNMFTMACIGFGSAGQVIISQFVGRKDAESLSKTIGTFSSFLLLLAFVFMLIGLYFTDELLGLLHVPREAFAQARSYSVICFAGMVFIFGYNIVSAILRGMGDSKTPLVFITIATVLNVALDLVFIAAAGMDAKGAALATVIGQGVSFVGAVAYLYKRREAFGFDFKPRSFLMDAKLLKVILSLGLPMVMQTCAAGVSDMIVHSFVNAYGVTASAVTGVGTKLNSMMRIVTTALHIAGATMIGQNYAAGEKERVARTVNMILLIALSAGALMSGLMLLFPQQVFSFFSSDPEVLAMADEYAPIAAVSFMGYASRSAFIGLINGLGFAALSFTIGLIDATVARIGLALLLGSVFGLGVFGYWLGGVLGGFTCTIIGGVYYISGKWKKRGLIVN